MSKTHVVSVITPVYNGVNTLMEVIESVRSNYSVVLEHVIVDDGSTDGTTELLAEVRSNQDYKVRVISQQNSGEALAVNNGIAHSLGEYIMIVNADDPILSGSVEKLHRALLKEKDAVVAYGDWRMIDELGRTIRSYVCPSFSRQTLIGDWVCIVGPGSMIRKEAFKDQTPRKPEYKNIGDYEMWLRLALSGNFVHVHEEISTWRNHSAGATRSDRGRSLVEQYQRLHKQFFSGEDLPAEVYALRDRAEAHMLYYSALQKLFDGKVHGRRMILRSWVVLPRCRYESSSVKRSIIGSLAILLFPFSLWVARLLRGLRFKFPPLINDALETRRQR
jgi:glycosyltransferase involved in cell wall biosynthesis